MFQEIYTFIFTIPDGESASVSITARDIGGRVDRDVIVVDNHQRFLNWETSR